VSALALIATSGCENSLPTLSGEGPFPVGSVATTIEYFIESDDLLLGSNTYTGPTGVEDFVGLLVANEFDGGLTAHPLVTFGTFPDTIQVESESDGDFLYLGGEVLGVVSDTLSASDAELTLQLWSVAQPWDTTAVSWENAVDRPGETVPWVEPGGTRGDLLGTVTWSRTDADADADSLVWSIPPSVVDQLAEDELQGLMVTVANDDSRLVISNLVLRTEIQPSVDPDTVVTRTVGAGPQTFVFTPEPPQPAEALRVGGITSDRMILQLAVPQELPGCSPPQSCATLSADEVTLDRVELIIDPIPVGSGFRPVQPTVVIAREVIDPELGERAPLGAPIFLRPPSTVFDTISAPRFTPAGDQPIRLRVTSAYLQSIQSGESTLAVALLVEPEASSFAYMWFERKARLRLLYTLPQTPQLP
jgi:hypothetical protein